MSNEQHIKMVLTSENELKKEVLSKDDPTTSYIILQNRKYQEMIEDITNENITMKKDLEEQENELDSLMKSKTCLQGYIKNEYEFALNWKFIANFYKEIGENSFKWISLFVVSNFMSIWIGLLAVSNLYYLKMYISFANLVFMVVFAKYMLLIHYTLNKNKEINKIIEEIKKIEKSNQYLQDLIDNI
jgi:hypothetical protein